jgi:hypothetical protein
MHRRIFLRVEWSFGGYGKLWQGLLFKLRGVSLFDLPFWAVLCFDRTFDLHGMRGW